MSPARSKPEPLDLAQFDGTQRQRNVAMMLRDELALSTEVAALREQVRVLREALTLTSNGLRNGSVKAKPIISFGPKSESADIQSLEEIIDAALARTGGGS